jgi:hypothetical protein
MKGWLVMPGSSASVYPPSGEQGAGMRDGRMDGRGGGDGDGVKRGKGEEAGDAGCGELDGLGVTWGAGGSGGGIVPAGGAVHPERISIAARSRNRRIGRHYPTGL